MLFNYVKEALFVSWLIKPLQLNFSISMILCENSPVTHYYILLSRCPSHRSGEKILPHTASGRWADAELSLAPKA
jgi:hypothetical protein